MTVALLAGCSGGPVEIDGEPPSGADLAACEALVDDLPDELGDQRLREVSAEAYAAAWGDPALVLTCGVAEPEEFDPFSQCVEIDGVGWFVPPAQEEDPAADVLLTAVGFSPRVSLLVPAELRGGTSAAALSELAGPVKRHLELVDACA
jgi:hypothetical protein